MNVERAIADAIGATPTSLRALGGGCVGEVYRVAFETGLTLVAKVGRGSDARLDVEGFMLDYLAPHLPVPKVVHAAPELLVMEFLEGGSGFSPGVEEHAAELLASLHGVTRSQFGLERDTLIGGLHQPNPASYRWVPFFAEQRLVHMAAEAHGAGQLPAELRTRVEALAGELARLLHEPAQPALLHGDVWSGNVLAQGGRVSGFLDPAIYYGHPEVELAFITMFSTFGERFFAAYDAMRPIEAGFMEERRHVYNLYPYLVHVRLFGGSYVGSVESILSRLGY